MFLNPFSSEGRIRRTEYGLSILIYVFCATIISMIITSNKDASFVAIAYIPMLWFLISQNAKRCHDVGNSGWFQFIPFYGLWLLFEDGQIGLNNYGVNPKDVVNSSATSSSTVNNTTTVNPDGYVSGSYTGGHNSPNNGTQQQTNVNTSQFYSSSDTEFKSGDLYK